MWVSLGGQYLEGYVTGLLSHTDVSEIKPIKQVLGEGPVFSIELITLARWMEEYYLCPLLRVLKAMLPPTATRAVKNQVRLTPLTEDEWIEVVCRWEEFYPEAAGILTYLKQHGETTVTRLARLDPQNYLKTLEILASQGLISGQLALGETRRRKGKQHAEEEEVPSEYPVQRILTREQESALDQILDGMEDENPRPILLHGVTASGKTEIYLRAVEQALGRGRGSMVLVPEISLTPQMTGVFKERFGRQVAILHSRLTGSERRREWNRLQSGEASIVIGARSAVFAPVRSLGLIIMDEEHEVSYKQDSTPRYHCREVARKRAEINQALLVLGSATPSVESYHRAVSGEYRLVRLAQRVESRPLPQVCLVDMREEIRDGNRSIFSRRLQDQLLSTWEKGEQSILFLNRRGFASFVSCRKCGYVMRCSFCDVALTYHQSDGRLRCHYCDQKRRRPPACPECGSSMLRQFGLGTQRVEEETRKLLPEARIVRADFDTLGMKDGENCLERFKRGEAEVLIGTQMIAKGLDFPMVTLVGVITADISLNQPDFRSGERTFQLLTQVAGRAGRGEVPGEVVIQTYSPEHYSLLTSMGHDYQGFFRAEIQYRQNLGYPPYSQMIRVLISGPDESSVRTGSELLARYLEAAIAKDPTATTILGPAPAPLSRIRGQHRWQLVLKGDLDRMRPELLCGLERFQAYNPHSKINIAVDVEPYSLL